MGTYYAEGITCIVIYGPQGTGKTARAFDVARRLGKSSIRRLDLQQLPERPYLGLDPQEEAALLDGISFNEENIELLKELIDKPRRPVLIIISNDYKPGQLPRRPFIQTMHMKGFATAQ